MVSCETVDLKAFWSYSFFGRLTQWLWAKTTAPTTNWTGLTILKKWTKGGRLDFFLEAALVSVHAITFLLLFFVYCIITPSQWCCV